MEDEKRIPLKENEICQLTTESEVFNCKIYRMIGLGGSSIVYEVYCDGDELGRLKEYYPYDMSVKRDDDGKLIISKDEQLFEERRKYFEQIIDKKAELVQLNCDIADTMPEYCKIMRGNNTSYYFQSYSKGQCYADVGYESLQDILKTAIGLVRSLKCYHDIDFVHLDVKPENMLVSKQNDAYRVQLFDFETATSIKDLKNGKVRWLSYSEYYSSPEQIQEKYSDINVYSDVFSVGIILFNKILGRFPQRESRELAMGATYEYNTNSTLFDGVPKIIQKLFDELFEHTIRIATMQRYNSDNELIKMLERLLDIASGNQGIIPKKNYYSDIKSFIGRENDMEDLYYELQSNSLILIYGMGGIGKSEFIKKFLSENEDLFYKIVYIEDTGNSIKAAIINDDNVKIDKLRKTNDSSDDEYFDIKLDYIRKDCQRAKESNKYMIFVLDNVELFEDFDTLKSLKEIGCKVILISRDPWEGISFDFKIEINRIGNIDDEITLFLTHYDNGEVNDVEKDAIEKIINHYQGHPFLLELLAKAMNSSGKTPSEILEQIGEEGVSSSGDEKIRYIEKGKTRQETVENIIYNLFDDYRFSEKEIEFLQFMALIPTDGISKTEIRKFFDNMQIANGLISRGFVRSSHGKISLHPIISEMITHRHPLEESFVQNLIKKVSDLLSTKKNFNMLTVGQITLYVHIAKNLVKTNKCDDALFFDYLANACQRIGQGESAKKYYEKCIEIQKKKYGENDERIALSYMRYGRVLGINGDYDRSKEYLEKSLILMKNEKSSGSNRDNGENYDKKLNIAKTYNQLARWYCDQGNCEEALRYCEQAYSIADEQACTNKRALIKLYYFADTRAGILFECSKYKEALEYYEKSYQIKSGLYENENVYFLHSYLGIAKCRLMLGRYESARENIDKAVCIAEKMKGIDSIDTAKVYHYAGKIYEILSQNREAEMYFDTALRTHERLLGRKNSFTLFIEVDYLSFKSKLSGKCEISVEEYFDLSDRIRSKSRPRTESYVQLCKKMQMFAEQLHLQGESWN